MWRKAVRLRPLIARESKRFKDLNRSRSAVEREFGRVKHECALLPLRVVDLIASLCISSVGSDVRESSKLTDPW
jgi:hypothetical protein